MASGMDHGQLSNKAFPPPQAQNVHRLDEFIVEMNSSKAASHVGRP